MFGARRVFLVTTSRRNGKSNIDRQIAAAIYRLIVGLVVGGVAALIGEHGAWRLLAGFPGRRVQPSTYRTSFNLLPR